MRRRARADLDEIPPILQVVAARPAAWQEDLAVRLALRLRAARPRPDDVRVRLALALLRRDRGRASPARPAHPGLGRRPRRLPS
ncbi:hypothetical protein GCM10020220_010990 [Nonomuraea rubra]|uniref:hypothetical protein n=1 Tax=Nonomuraea rubra TaxID=46180 RepID=UPI0031E91720